MKLRADRILLDYGLDRAQTEEVLAETFPWVPEHERNSWLDNSSIEKIVSDGEERFFGQIADNIAYRNLTLYHQWKDHSGPDMLKNMMIEILDFDANRTGTYFNPVNYTANGVLTIERSLLPSTGTLEIWIPAPIETASQTNVTVLTALPEVWIKTMPAIGSDLGQIYLEVPLDGLTADVVVNVSYSLTAYQKHFTVDPATVGQYDKTSADYITYTKSHDNILVTPEIIAEAKAVVGEETNPYLQAKLLYDYVVGNITYSFMPHVALCAMDIAESEYVRINRYGDCGAQSMYYSALLRSLGVPARADGGYQTFGGGTGSHFWAEFYLPNCGWVPVDVTAADAMDWIGTSAATDQERAAYKAYYFGNLDRMRYVIQNDVDVALSPSPAMPMPIAAAFQNPMGSCVTSDQDVPIMAMMFWQFKITATA
jgi:transglutaminase-like putative cysteine protease